MSEARRPSPLGQRRRSAAMTPAGGHDDVGLVGGDDRHREAPRDLARAPAAAPRPGDAPPASSSSIRWARTSVSVSDTKAWPSATQLGGSSRWFSMMPLWTTARRPVQSRWGWAFSSVGGRGWPSGCGRCRPARRPGACDARSRSSATEWVPSAAPGPPECRPAVDQGHAGRVVAPVLEALQALEQDRRARRPPPVTPMMPHMAPRLPGERAPPHGALTGPPGRSAPLHGRRTAARAASAAWPSVPRPPPSPGPAARCRSAAAAPGRCPRARPRPRPPPPRPPAGVGQAARVGDRHVDAAPGAPRIDQAAGELGERAAERADQVEQQQPGEHAVAGGGLLAEDDVARTARRRGPGRSASRAASTWRSPTGVSTHVDAPLGHGQAEPEVGHDRHHHGVAGQLAPARPGRRRTAPAARRRRPPPRCGRRRSAGRRRRRRPGRGRRRRADHRARPGPRGGSSRSRR